MEIKRKIDAIIKKEFYVKRKHCHFCGKKYGLVPFTCYCGGKFCVIHRHSFAHNCSFDYKSFEREKIRIDNPIVVQDKVSNRI